MVAKQEYDKIIEKKGKPGYDINKEYEAHKNLKEWEKNGVAFGLVDKNLKGREEDKKEINEFMTEFKDDIAQMPESVKKQLALAARMGDKIAVHQAFKGWQEMQQEVFKAKIKAETTGEKSQTEEQLTARALKGDKEAQNILDAMQNRKLRLAEATMDVKAKDIDIGSLASAVAEGQDARMAIKGSMGNPVASKVQSKVLEKYPKFDFNMSDANYKWKQSQVNMRTVNFVGGALPRMEALSNQLNALPNVDIPLINKVMRQVSIQTGKPEYSNFESNRNAIVQEINTALSGSATGSDMRIKIELENLQSTRSPKQIIGAINNLREALIARLDVDLSPLYPLEVVQGKKSMDQYKKELYKSYRGKYGESPSTTGDLKSLSNEELLKRLEGK